MKKTIREISNMSQIASCISDFEKLRNEGYLYVDKSEFVWNLINPAGKSYFLSRPRRFGKSLLLSTLKAVSVGLLVFLYCELVFCRDVACRVSV